MSSWPCLHIGGERGLAMCEIKLNKSSINIKADVNAYIKCISSLWSIWAALRARYREEVGVWQRRIGVMGRSVARRHASAAASACSLNRARSLSAYFINLWAYNETIGRRRLSDGRRGRRDKIHENISSERHSQKAVTKRHQKVHQHIASLLTFLKTGGFYKLINK